jgi:hypothetical protein
MRGLGARSFIFTAAWGAALLPACGIDASGLKIDDVPDDGGARASGHVSDGGWADSFVLDVVTLPNSDAAFGDVANDAGQEAATLDASDAPDQSQLDAPSGPLDCDRDGDGWLAVGGGCNGEDCCDTDPNAHPQQTSFFTGANHCGSFDYDCNGVITPEYGQASCQPALGGCTGDGFDQPQACGVTASFAHCALGFLTCTTMSQTKTQGCR